MISVRQTLRKLSPWHREIMSFDTATEDDLYFCYRLLLGREPEQEAWDNFKWRLDVSKLPVGALVDEFLDSPEFLANRRNPRKPVLVELDEFKIYVRRNDYFIGATIKNSRRYEPHVTAQVASMLKEGDVFVDIGANIGYFTLLAAKIVGPKGHVHAFEPIIGNLELLAKSLEENAFQNVTIYPYAVAEERTTFQLELSGSDSNSRVLDLSESSADEDELELIVEAYPLDELLKDCSRIDIIKMDIEGAEARAWSGMKEIVQRFKPAIFLEFSPNLIRPTSHIEPATLLWNITNTGYDLSAIDFANGQLVTMATPEMVMDRWESSVENHIDLLAKPKA